MKRVLVKLNCNPYTNVNIWFTNSHKLYSLQVMKIRDEPAIQEYDSAGVVSADDSRGNMVIGMFCSSSDVLVHELSHAVINIFHFIGMDVNIHTTEAFAYMLESLYKQCTDNLNEWSL